MTASITRLLFTGVDANNSTILYDTDGSTVSALTTDSSPIAFVSGPGGGAANVFTLGGFEYFTIADTTTASTAIWQWNGATLKQITASSKYVYSVSDASSSAATPYPMTSFNGSLVFDQGSLAANAAGDDSFDTTTLTLWNPSTGAFTTPAAPNGALNPHDFITFNSNLYFIATDTTTKAYAVYGYNGTSVIEIYNLHPTFTFDVGAGPTTIAAAGQVLDGLTVFNGSLVFGGGQAAVEKLTALTANSNSASLVNPLNSLYLGYYQYSSSPPGNMVVDGSYLYEANSEDGVDAISTGGAITNIVYGAGSGAWTPASGTYNGNVIFTSLNFSTFQTDLYETNGGAAAIDLVHNFSGSNLVVAGSTLYYNNQAGGLGEVNLATKAITSLAIPGSTVANPIVGTPVQTFTITPTGFGAAASPATLTAGATAHYAAGGSAAVLDAALSVADTASTTLTSATIVIASSQTAPAGAFASGDTLNFTNQNGITGVYDPTYGVLTLNGTATLAQYKAALASITYSFNATLAQTTDPTNGGADNSRTIEWAIGDGVNNSLAATSTLSLTVAAAQAPVVTIGLVSDSGSSSTDGITNNDALTGTADAGATVTISLGGTALGTTAANASGVWTYTPAALAQGSETLTVSETNAGLTGTANLTFTYATSAPTVSSPTFTASENEAAAGIGIAAPTDTNFAASSLTIKSATLPTDGAVTLADGVTAVISGQTLTVAQLTGLKFKPTAGQFGASSSFTYTVSDLAGNSSTGTATLAIGAAVGNPVASSPTVTVAENAVATAIGIAAPTDPNYAASSLTIKAATLPTDGTVTLADGVTAVTSGQTLTVAQLTGLAFKPTAGVAGVSSSFTYTVTDPASNSSTGTATLAIGAAVPTGVFNVHVYNDANGDATQDAGEANLPGVTVALLSGLGVPTGVTAATDANGNVSFTGLQAGAYEVSVTTPAGDSVTQSSNILTAVTLGAGGLATATEGVHALPILSAPMLALTVAEGQTLTNLWSTIIANATDPAPATLAITAVGIAGTQGYISFNAASQSLTYLATGSNPAAGPDAFTYTLTDGAGASTTGTVDVTVTGAAIGTTVATGSGASTAATGSGQRLISQGAGQSLIGSAAGGDELFGGSDTAMSASGSGNTVYAAPGNHVIALGASNNTATLHNGNNTISASGTGNTITAGDGNDTVSGMSGTATITLGNGKESVVVSGGGNVVTVGTGADLVNAGTGGHETIVAGDGANTLTAGGTGDSFTAGNGANTVVASGAGATITLGNGGDKVTATGSGDGITTGSGNDTITDNAGGATIRAGLGLNTIKFAGSGSTIANQGGTDTLTDNGSNNTIVLAAAGQGSDVMNAGVLTNGDTFDLRTALAATSWDRSTSDIGSYLSVTPSGSNAVVQLATTSGGAAVTIATITGGSGTNVAGFLSHSVLS